MANIARGILGGLAGGFKAYGEVVDQRIADKLEEKKQAALEQRQKNLARFSSDLALEREQTISAGEREYQKGLLTEQRKYQSEEKAGDREFLAKSKAKELEASKELLTHEYGLREQLELIKPRKLDVTTEKYIEQKAFDDVKAFLSTQGADWDSENKKEFIFYDISPEKKDMIQKAIDGSGFGFNAAYDPKQKTFQLNLKSFNSSNIRAIEYPEETKEVNVLETKGDIFSKIYDFVRGGKKDTATKPPETNKGLAFPMGDSMINTDRSEVEQQSPGLVTPKEGPTGLYFKEPEDQTPVIGTIGDKQITRTEKGYMIIENGKLRMPTEDEQTQITRMAMQGKLAQTPGKILQYKTDPNVRKY